MMKFDELIGETIGLKPKKPFAQGQEGRIYSVKLHGVEYGGLWIESPDLHAMLNQAVGVPPGQKTPKIPMFFFPFSEIGFVLVPATRLPEELV
jgi:hypothetical protein